MPSDSASDRAKSAEDTNIKQGEEAEQGSKREINPVLARSGRADHDSSYVASQRRVDRCRRLQCRRPCDLEGRACDYCRPYRGVFAEAKRARRWDRIFAE